LTVTEDFCVEAVGLVPEALLVFCGATEVGTTAFEGVETDVPPTFVAVTEKVYEVPDCSPTTLADVAVPGTVTAAADGAELMVNEVAAPPVSGSNQWMVAEVTPAVAVTPVGAAGMS
jgi:hypothetical protein